ncbi:MAG: prepilin-type N-terminal cleavage/methylation domain-containing protein [Candidatus Brocadiales bacterium]
MRFIERARRLLTGLKKTKGFTLPEVAAVVAITGALAAVIVPVAIDQIENAHVARAKQDVNGISAAISLFHKDTGVWPVREDSSTPTGVTILRSGNANANFTAFGTETTEGNVKDPALADDSMVWSSGASGAQAMVNHLTLDNPGGSTSTPNHGYIDADVNWNGPYMPQTFNDPWGRNYLVYVNAFVERSVGGEDVYVWIITGGPNETLETDVNSPILNNSPAPDSKGLSSVSDDIGVMMFQARRGVEGISGG